MSEEIKKEVVENGSKIMEEPIPTTPNAQPKIEKKVKTEDEMLSELKEMHVSLSKNLLSMLGDIEVLKDNKESIDSFNMATLQVQAMNLYSYFLSIRIRMMELEKQAKILRAENDKLKEQKSQEGGK